LIAWPSLFPMPCRNSGSKASRFPTPGATRIVELSSSNLINFEHLSLEVLQRIIDRSFKAEAYHPMSDLSTSTLARQKQENKSQLT
jgi:hypothetical protein